MTHCRLVKDQVHCGKETFSVAEGPLNSEDTMFWVYLGVYVALVLFAGK